VARGSSTRMSGSPRAGNALALLASRMAARRRCVDLGGEQSPWKDRLHEPPATSACSANSSMEQRLEVGCSAPFPVGVQCGNALVTSWIRCAAWKSASAGWFRWVFDTPRRASARCGAWQERRRAVIPGPVRASVSWRQVTARVGPGVDVGAHRKESGLGSSCGGPSRWLTHLEGSGFLLVGSV